MLGKASRDDHTVQHRQAQSRLNRTACEFTIGQAVYTHCEPEHPPVSLGPLAQHASAFLPQSRPCHRMVFHRYPSFIVSFRQAPQSWQEKGLAPDDLLITNLTRHHCGRRQLSDGSRSNRHRRSSPLGAVNLAQQLALSLSGREVGNEGINGSVSSGRSKQFKLPSRLTYSRSPTRRQPTGNSTAAAATPAPASTTASVKPADGPNRNPRSRSKPPKVKIAEDCSHGLSKMRRPRSWTSGILKSPTLSNSFSRAWHAGAVVNHRTRGRSRADTEENCGGGSGAGGGRRGTAVDAAVAALAHDAEQSTSMFMSYDIRSAFDSPTSDYSYQP